MAPKRRNSKYVVEEEEPEEVAAPAEEEPIDESLLKTAASECIAEGIGLTEATVREEASFTIVAHDGRGEQMEEGGDPFFVSIRGAHCRRSNSDFLSALNQL